MPRRIAGVVAPALVAITLAAGRAEAQPSPQQAAVAEALVERGNELMVEGKLDEACRKFDEADKVSDSWATGALAKLAECHEKAGRLASAWGTWVKAELAASRAGKKDRADYAKSRAADLDGRVPKLTVVVPDALRDQAGVEVLRDGAPLARTEWGLPIRVDPGRRTVRVTAPLHVAWEASLELRTGDVQLLAPARLDEVPVPGAVPPSTTDIGVGRVQRHVGITVGVLGLAALEVAGGLAIATLTKGADASFACGPKLCPTESAPGAVLANDARKLQTGAIVSTIFGAAVVASGVAIYLTAPSSRRNLGARARGGGSLVFHAGGAALRGRW